MTVTESPTVEVDDRRPAARPGQRRHRRRPRPASPGSGASIAHDLVEAQRRGLVRVADEPGDARGVAHRAPGLVGEVHADQDVAGELVAPDAACAAPFLISVTSSVGHLDLEDEVLHVERGDRGSRGWPSPGSRSRRRSGSTYQSPGSVRMRSRKASTGSRSSSARRPPRRSRPRPRRRPRRRSRRRSRLRGLGAGLDGVLAVGVDTVASTSATASTSSALGRPRPRCSIEASSAAALGHVGVASSGSTASHLGGGLVERLGRVRLGHGAPRARWLRAGAARSCGLVRPAQPPKSASTPLPKTRSSSATIVAMTDDEDDDDRGVGDQLACGSAR